MASRRCRHSADTTQIQTIMAGTTRQVNVIEDHVYQVLERKREDPRLVATAVDDATKQISAIIEKAVVLIQKYAEPPNDSEQQGRI